MDVEDLVTPRSGWLVVGEEGTSRYSGQPAFLLYPLVVVGHSGVNARTKLFCTAIPPADHTKQPEPVVNLAYQRTPGVSLRQRGVRRENQRAIPCRENQKKHPAWTCWEYLASILAPVRTTGTKHVLVDLVCIIVLMSTHIISKDVHLSFPQVLRFVPQACAREIMA